MFLFCVDSPKRNLKRKFSYDAGVSSLLASPPLSSSRGNYFERCDTAFAKKEHWMQPKLSACHANSSLHSPNGQSAPFERPTRAQPRTLDLSQREKAKNKSNEKRRSVHFSVNAFTGPETTHRPKQYHPCDHCSIRFSSLRTLLAHRENYCIGSRRDKAIQRVTDSNSHESTIRANHR